MNRPGSCDARQVGEELVDHLLAFDQLPVEVGGLAEEEVEEDVERGEVRRGRERRAVEADGDPRQCRVGQGGGRARAPRAAGSLRYVDGVRGAAPATRPKCCLDQRGRRLLVRRRRRRSPSCTRGRYQRSKNVREYSYCSGMASMSAMKPIVVCW